MDVEQMEQEAQAIKEGSDPAAISDPDEVIEEMDQEIADVGDDFVGGPGDGDGETEPESDSE
jgi:alkanesulfonate monooxygenase SsuD/methylene tetrahydromethanopterin reductase-like flavin-dependent oxidoreductase (luciferase family)